jgi:hypothetical protein
VVVLLDYPAIAIQYCPSRLVFIVYYGGADMWISCQAVFSWLSFRGCPVIAVLLSCSLSCHINICPCYGRKNTIIRKNTGFLLYCTVTGTNDFTNVRRRL